MVRVNKKKSASTRRRALVRQRNYHSERVSQGETGVLKNTTRHDD